MQSFKEKVHHTYTEKVLDKIKALQQQQEDLLESLKQETKSTAGDKYETSRAMLHIEQQNVTGQLSVLLQQKAILESIPLNKNSQTETKIQFGNLVKTNRGYVFIAAALGKIIVDKQSIFAISAESPLGKLLINQTTGMTIKIQSASYTIEAIS